VNTQEQKQAIIVSLHDDVKEISELAFSLEYNVVQTFIQHRKDPDVTSYIGSGKLNEIKTFLIENDTSIDVAIIDGELKPSQWFHLEKEWDILVYDRIRLILEIFKDRATRKEARLQVRLAELEYEKPFVKELIHRARSGEHPGLMAGGEYQVNDYYEMIKKQMKNTQEELRKIEKDRDIQRKHRHKSGFYLVSLAGYTNAGKSSLLNILSNDTITVEDRLFSTLSTTTRRIEEKHIPILITDTVGFIQRLPSWIIDAFHSTLEEIQRADVIIVVIDGSDTIDVIKQKLQTSLKELTNLEIQAPVLIVINKIDLISEDELKKKIDQIKKNEEVPQRLIVPISIKEKRNIDILLEKLYESLPSLAHLHCVLPNNSATQSFISWLHTKTNVVSLSYGRNVDIIIDCNPKFRDKIISISKQLQGTTIVIDEKDH